MLAILIGLVAALTLKTDGNNDSPLMKACGKGDLAAVQQLLQDGTDADEWSYEPWDTRKKFGHAPLERACYYGHVDVARALLEAGADPDTAPGEDKSSVLQVAAMGGKQDIVKLLLEFKAKPDLGNRYNQKPLYFVARYHKENYLASAKMLLDAGAHPKWCSGKNSCMTPLEVAVGRENLPMAKLLLENGADPNVVAAEYGVHGKNMLWIAVRSNNKYGTRSEMVKTLLDHGANPEQELSGNLTILKLVQQDGRVGKKRDEVRDMIEAHVREQRAKASKQRKEERAEARKKRAAGEKGPLTPAQIAAIKKHLLRS